jgi:hypothetical protein
MARTSNFACISPEYRMNRANLWTASLLMVSLVAVACGQDAAPQSQQGSALESRKDNLSQMKALILGRTVVGGESSLEAQAAHQYGMAVKVATDAEWAAMTVADFASYRVIILGDANCADLSAVSAAVANRHVWGRAISGNMFIAGNAPVATGAPQLVTERAVRFAASQSGMTGLYASLSCYYQNAAPNTHVALLEPFGDFAVQSGACYATTHIVSEDPALEGLNDEMMSGWPCSVNAQFSSYPSADFAPWSIAKFPAGSRTSDTSAKDYADGTFGAPYILARGTVLTGCGNYDDGDVNEACDWGHEINGTPGVECSATCQFHWCGDGVVDPGESCDDGFLNGMSLTACPRSCRILNAPPPSHRPPVAHCKHVALSAGPSCGGVGASIDDGSSDPDGDLVNCVQSITSFETGTTQAMLTCTDAAGLTGSCTGQVTVVDDSAPVISCPAPSTLECGTGTSQLPAAQAQDNCVSPTVTSSLPSEGFALGAAKHVLWTATDGINQASCTSSVTLVDTLAPSLSLKGQPVQQLECGLSAYGEEGALAIDKCSGDLSARVAISGEVDTGAVGVYPVSYSVADAAGHSVSALRTVKVADTLAPSLALNGEGAVAVECGVGSYTELSAQASDACSGNLSTKVAISGEVDTARRGTYPVSYRVADLAGNASTAVRTVNVNDTLAPSLSLVGSTSMKLECGVDSYSNPGAQASDACSGNLTAAVTTSGAVDTAAVGTYPVTYSVADGAGLSTSAVRTVQVADTKAPALALNGAAAVAVECGVGSYTEPGATATDACTGNVSNKVTISGAVDTAKRGAYPVSYRVADVSGNEATAVRTVNVNDTLAPSLSLVGAATLKLECGVDSFTNQGATATDMCSGNLTDAITSSGTVNTAAVGSYPITYNVKDAAGLTASATRTVQVADTKAPALALKGASTVAVECNVGQYTEAGTTALDACTGDVNNKVTVSGTVNRALPGSYPLTYRVADSAGNASTAVRTVNVNDTLAPVITLTGSAAMTLECKVDLFSEPGYSASDFCSGSLSAAVTKTGSVDDKTVGTYTLRYDVKDGANLAASALRTVEVKDTKAPSLVLNGSSSMTVECGSAYTEPGVTATDVCTSDMSGRVTTTGTVNAGARGTYSLTYSATDAASNTTSAVRTVEVKDTKAPSIALVGAASMTVNRGSTFVDPGTTSSDQCPGALTTVKTGSVNTAVAGTYTLTYKVTDAAGLFSSVSRTVTVAAAGSCNTTVTVKPVQQIWPPNHNYQSFSLSDCAAVVTTSCGDSSGGADVNGMGTILSIYSDELENANGNGDGNTVDDIVITGHSTFKVRAERDGKGNGRVYGIRFRVTDSSGASQTATCKFSVPHDQGDTSVVDDGAVAGYTVTSSY